MSLFWVILFSIGAACIIGFFILCVWYENKIMRRWFIKERDFRNITERDTYEQISASLIRLDYFDYPYRKPLRNKPEVAEFLSAVRNRRVTAFLKALDMDICSFLEKQEYENGAPKPLLFEYDTMILSLVEALKKRETVL